MHRFANARPAVLLAALVALVAACGDDPAADPAGEDRRPNVVATFSIVGDWCRTVGGEGVELTVLVGPGADVHAYRPTPGDLRSLAEADLVVGVGLGLETWLADLHRSAGSEAEVLHLGEGTDVLQFAGDHVHHGHDHGHDHDHGHGEGAEGETIDPHFWLDPLLAGEALHRLAAGLANIDPGASDGYQLRAEAASLRLADLQREYAPRFADLPAGRRLVVVDHPSLGYLARRFDLEQRSLRKDHAQVPSAGTLVDAVTMIREHDVPALFAEFQFPDEFLHNVAREAGVVVAGPLYTGCLSDADGPAADYEALLRHDLETLLEGLRR